MDETAYILATATANLARALDALRAVHLPETMTEGQHAALSSCRATVMTLHESLHLAIADDEDFPVNFAGGIQPVEQDGTEVNADFVVETWAERTENGGFYAYLTLTENLPAALEWRVKGAVNWITNSAKELSTKYGKDTPHRQFVPLLKSKGGETIEYRWYNPVSFVAENKFYHSAVATVGPFVAPEDAGSNALRPAFVERTATFRDEAGRTLSVIVHPFRLEPAPGDLHHGAVMLDDEDVRAAFIRKYAASIVDARLGPNGTWTLIFPAGRVPAGDLFLGVI